MFFDSFNNYIYFYIIYILVKKISLQWNMYIVCLSVLPNFLVYGSIYELFWMDFTYFIW